MIGIADGIAKETSGDDGTDSLVAVAASFWEDDVVTLDEGTIPVPVDSPRACNKSLGATTPVGACELSGETAVPPPVTPGELVEEPEEVFTRKYPMMIPSTAPTIHPQVGIPAIVPFFGVVFRDDSGGIIAFPLCKMNRLPMSESDVLFIREIFCGSGCNLYRIGALRSGSGSLYGSLYLLWKLHVNGRSGESDSRYRCPNVIP